MKKLNINLENCYGIKELVHSFDFEKSRVNLIYAKNGSMKTSFAKVFKNIQDGEGEKIKDYIFNNETKFEIKIDDKELNYDEENKNIFVIKSFDQSYFATSISSLLFKENIKKKFEEKNEELKNYKRTFLNEFKHYFEFVKNGNEDLTPADIKKINVSFEKHEDFETEIIEVFSKGKKDIYEILSEINKNYDLDKEQKYDRSIDLKYSIFLNPTVTSFLEKEGVKNLVNIYIEKYKELIENSDYFNLKFNHQNAQKILKDLENKYHYFVTYDESSENENSFNLVNKKGDLDKKEKWEIEVEIKKIQNAIQDDKESSEVLKRLDKKIDGNKVLKFFRDYLVENIGIMVNYKDEVNVIKKDLMISYLKNKYSKKEFNDFVLEVLKVYGDRNKILEELKNDDQTLWHEAVHEFNERFSVPFNIYISKSEKEKSLIKGTGIEELKYRFCDGENKLCENGTKKWEDKDKKVLMEGGDDSILSQGERRAFYLLNIIFEIKQRKKNNTETLFIIDDIADSFDYKNKYAIVEYLQEIAKEENFYSIILTHNFDFFRTIKSRLNIPYKGSAFIVEQDDEKKLNLKDISELNILNPFVFWKEDLSVVKNVLALIPFVRNLVEYNDDIGSDNYKKLTHLLHKKKNDSGILETEKITFQDISDIYKKYLGKNIDNSLLKKKVYEELLEVKVLDLDINLENKVILAIKTRLKAEEFMISKINSDSFVNKISGNQTRELFNKIKEDNLCNKEELEVLDRVNIMTPESIHLNSFMYEPILDMDISELKNLYEKIKTLNEQ